MSGVDKSSSDWKTKTRPSDRVRFLFVYSVVKRSSHKTNEKTDSEHILNEEISLAKNILDIPPFLYWASVALLALYVAPYALHTECEI